jgi:hypothetical protein
MPISKQWGWSVSPRRFQLDGATLGELKQRVQVEHGPDARIVAVEQVTSGGLGGFFATRRFEVTVEVPDGPSEAIDAHDLDPARRVGLAALLDEADAADGAPGARPGGSGSGSGRGSRAGAGPGLSGFDGELSPAVSTASREFAEILDELHSVTDALVSAPAAVAVPPPARLLTGVGDLVIVAGAPAEALSVARAMSFTVQADVVVAGSAVAEGLDRIDDRRGAITARARGVERERLVIAAFGLSTDRPLAEQAGNIAALRGDQIWLAVDSSRKPDDTARWVAELSSVIIPDAVAALGRETTATPETVRELGLPVSWTYDG